MRPFLVSFIFLVSALSSSSLTFAAMVEKGDVPEFNYASITAKPFSGLEDMNQCMPTSASNASFDKLIPDGQIIADQAYYQAQVKSPISQDCRSNNTITHVYKGKESRFKVTADDNIIKDCDCLTQSDIDNNTNQDRCFCFPNDNSFVSEGTLWTFYPPTGTYEGVCQTNEPDCGCEDLNLVVGIDSVTKEKTLYGLYRDQVVPLCACYSPFCQDYCSRPYSDVVIGGIRYTNNDQTYQMEARCFCSSLGCGCTGKNEARYVPMPDAPIRDVGPGDRFNTATGIWELCDCANPNCILGCPDYDLGPPTAEEMAALNAVRNERYYYDQSGQPQEGSNWGKVGTVLGIASAVIPFLGGGLGGGDGGSGASDAAGAAWMLGF